MTQDDALVTTLTLQETVYYSSELQLPASMSKAEKRKRADDCIKEMGLQKAINTRIGGWGSKGLSSGERRRLSICIEILTHPKLLFLDEPTSGLDSAASFYVMSRIVGNERRKGRTIIASIHQPSSQVFRLFDNLCLLSAGKTVYFGPAREANEVSLLAYSSIHIFLFFCGTKLIKLLKGLRESKSCRISLDNEQCSFINMDITVV